MAHLVLWKELKTRLHLPGHPVRQAHQGHHRDRQVLRQGRPKVLQAMAQPALHRVRQLARQLALQKARLKALPLILLLLRRNQSKRQNLLLRKSQKRPQNLYKKNQNPFKMNRQVKSLRWWRSRLKQNLPLKKLLQRRPQQKLLQSSKKRFRNQLQLSLHRKTILQKKRRLRNLFLKKSMKKNLLLTQIEKWKSLDLQQKLNVYVEALPAQSK